MSLYPHNLKNYMNISPLKFVCVICLISIALISCSENKKQSNSVAEIAENVSEEINKEGDAISNSIDELVENITETSPEIGVKLINNKEKSIELKYYVKNETATDIDIEPHGEYYDKYFSGKRFVFDTQPCYYLSNDNSSDYYYFYEYPTIDYTIVNNGDFPLNITRLDIEVEKSHLDTTPYIYITSETINSNYLTLSNFSCANWGNVKLEYSILKRNEKFTGKYSNVKVIPFFNGIKFIDLTEDFIKMGYDNKRVLALSEKNDISPNVRCYCIDEENKDEALNLFYPFELMRKESDSDTYIACARIYGRLSFSNHSKRIEFNGKVALSDICGYGDNAYENDRFDVKLNASGENYTKSYPYKTTIAPGEVERVRLIIGCDKSSYHNFVLKAINQEGRDLHSKRIKLHMMNHEGATIVNDQSFNELPEEFDY